MSHLDRLSALIERFDLSIASVPIEDANLVISVPTDGQHAWRLALHAPGSSPNSRFSREVIAFSARVAWGEGDNPLFTALPQTIDRLIEPTDDLDLLVRLLVTEHKQPRCGSATVLNRLGEVLIVRIVREALEQGSTEPGVLGGLADPRLGRVLVAIHETPGRNWRIEDLAGVAGLSRSQFASVFLNAVGESPLSYVRRWRTTLARQDLQRGEQVQVVARRYGYSSGEALNRAIQRRFGLSPLALRRHASSLKSRK